MRSLAYAFASFEELRGELEAHSDVQDLPLPLGAPRLADGEWILAGFAVDDWRVSVAACVIDSGDGLRVAFDDRDWQRLWELTRAEEAPEAEPASAPLSRRAQRSVPGAAAARVLVIDGNAETRELLLQLLAKHGYDPSGVASAEMAFDLLRQGAFDLVVADAHLPGMSACEFCRRARRESRLESLPIIILTAETLGTTRVSALNAGADDCLSVPYVASELSARIMGLLAGQPARD